MKLRAHLPPDNHRTNTQLTTTHFLFVRYSGNYYLCRTTTNVAIRT